MRYYSDVTKKFYESADECAKEEKARQVELEKIEAENQKKAEKRKEAAKKVEEAYELYRKAQKDYHDELSKFCETYGSFHMTLGKDDLIDWIDGLWGLF